MHRLTEVDSAEELLAARRKLRVKAFHSGPTERSWECELALAATKIVTAYQVVEAVEPCRMPDAGTVAFDLLYTSLCTALLSLEELLAISQRDGFQVPNDSLQVTDTVRIRRAGLMRWPRAQAMLALTCVLLSGGGRI
jgi:hypothetical protein